MYEAAKANDVALVNELLRQGAELEWRDPDDYGGGTPLVGACAKGSYEAAEALCAHGAELDARDDFSMTPLIFAAGGHPKICSMLLALGADHSLKMSDHMTALDWARGHNQPECVALLQPVAEAAAKVCWAAKVSLPAPPPPAPLPFPPYSAKNIEKCKNEWSKTLFSLRI